MTENMKARAMAAAQKLTREWAVGETSWNGVQFTEETLGLALEAFARDEIEAAKREVFEKTREACLNALDGFRRRHTASCDCTPMQTIDVVGRSIMSIAIDDISGTKDEK